MRLALAVSLLALAVLAPSADAAWFGAQPVDGPAPIVSLGNVSLGRDGTGGVVYVKQLGDNPAGFLSRFIGGAWGAPEPISGAHGVSEIQVAAGENGRLALAWISDGNVYAAVADGGPGAPVSAPVQLSNTGGASGLDMSLGSEGGAYAVWSQNGDVRAAMIEGTKWVAINQPLDIDPSHVAGQGAGRPRVAVAADDTAVVAWGELDGAGVSHVWYRRLLYTTLSAYPKEASIAGQGAADSPQIRVEYDRSFAWVTFRQDTGGVTHTYARRMRGSEFDAPVGIDNGVASTAPSLAMNPTGQGMTAVSGTDGSVLGALFADKAFRPAMRIDGGGSSSQQEPVAYFSDRADGAVAYRHQNPDGSAVALGKLLPGGALGPESTLSSGAGSVASGTMRLSGDRVGDAVLAMLQGSPGSYTLTAAVDDIPPSRPVISSRYVNPRVGGFAWNAGLDYLGAQSFRVRVDGRTLGASTTTRLRSARVRDGRHRVQVIGVDRRGQSAGSRVLTVTTDTRRPRVRRVTTSRAGRVLRVSIAASDPGKRASGVVAYTVDWGDGHTSSSGRSSLAHRYRTSGRHQVRVIVRDKARNETVKRLRA
jgi:hypothetical protein